MHCVKVLFGPTLGYGCVREKHNCGRTLADGKRTDGHFFFFFVGRQGRTSDRLKSRKNCANSPCRPAHNKESRGRWRHSVTTADEDASSPSRPTAAQRSNNKQMHVHWHMQTWTTNGDAMPAVCSTTEDTKHRTRLGLGQLTHEGANLL